MTTQKEAPAGRAYGFFYCSAPPQAVQQELPAIRGLAQTPSPLELSLTDVKSASLGNKKLDALAREADHAGLNYVLQATYPGHTNKTAADEVATVLNQAYQSPLYTKNEPFKGAVVYQEKGRPVFRA